MRRSRRHRLHDLTDHGFKIAGDAVDAAAALDLGFGVERRGFVSGLLGDQRLLEHLQSIRHGADFGRLALVRHACAQIAFAQRLHRSDDGGDPARHVANQIGADADAEDDRRTKDQGEHHQCRGITVGSILRRLVGASVVEVDVLVHDGIGLEPDLVDRLGVQLVRLGRNLAHRLARQRHHFLGARLVLVPEFRPLGIERALFRRRDHRLIGRAELAIGLDDGGERLFHRQLFLQRLGQHVLADHVAIGDDAGPQVAEHADARQPARRDVHRVGVDGAHVPDREQAHARHRDEQECHNGDDLGADGVFGEHGGNLLVLGASDAERDEAEKVEGIKRMPLRK